MTVKRIGLIIVMCGMVWLGWRIVTIYALIPAPKIPFSAPEPPSACPVQYVNSFSGNDENEGAAWSPVQTIQMAMEHLNGARCSTIYIQPGIHGNSRTVGGR